MFKLHRHLDLRLDKSHRDSLHALLRMFNICGKEVYLVGGCVRDALLDTEPKDIDLTTNATPDEMIELNKNYSNGEWSIIETGLKHGTVTFYNTVYKTSFEVTTYRADGEYGDHRHPDGVRFSTSLEEDLKRRDLTINSFAYDFNKHELYMLDESYLFDLEYGVIRCVGDAIQRFEEDALRMLRAIRFSAKLGFSIDEDVFNAIKEKADTITYVSHERIRDELTKIVMSPYPQMLELLSLTGLDGFIGLPITLMIEEHQHNKYHYTDVFHHTMDVMKACPIDFETRWAAFFHDWGKLMTKSTDSEGWEHYYGHPDVSVEMARIFMENYKFDNISTDHILTLVKYHDSAIGYQCKKKGMKKLITNIGEDLMPKFFKLTYADRLAHKLDDTAFSISQLDSGKKKYMELIMNPEPMRIKDLDIDGHDLIALGLEGKEIGSMLNELLEYVLENPDANHKDELITIVKIKKGVEKF